MQATQNHRPTRSGFTLIELLVVISIISLLIALLLPALSSARESARAIKCAAAQKQLGVTFEMYLETYDRWYPPRMWRTNVSPPQWYNPNPAMHSVYWFMLINGTMRGDAVFTTQGEGKIFRCPSHDTFNWATSSNRISYGYNYYGTATLPFAGVGNANERDIARLSDTIVLGDSIYNDTMYGNGSATNGIGNRHQGSVNVLWADGHVKRLPGLKVDQTTAWWTIAAD